MVQQPRATVLSRRERFQRALNHMEPDRVPIDLGSTGGGIAEASYFRLKEHLGLLGDEGTSLTDRNRSVADFDERVLKILDVDLRHLNLKRPRRRPGKVVLDGGDWADEWGIVHRDTEYYAQIVHSPLQDATLAEVESHAWPDPADPGRVEGLAERARGLYEKTDFGLSAKSVSGGTFLLCCRLRGMERFLVDMMLDKPLARALIARVEEVNLGLFEALLDAVGPYVQMVETQDDLGTQRAPFISPALYREMIQPAHARLAALIKKKTGARAKVFMHTDGSVFDLLPDLIDAGIEVLNPVQPRAWKMEPERVKSAFGDRLVLHGGLDQQQVIPNGTTEEVEAEVRTKLRVLAPGGGYVFSPCHNLQPDVPPENIMAMFRAAAEFGRYPIE